MNTVNSLKEKAKENKDGRGPLSLDWLGTKEGEKWEQRKAKGETKKIEHVL